MCSSSYLPLEFEFSYMKNSRPKFIEYAKDVYSAAIKTEVFLNQARG